MSNCPFTLYSLGSNADVYISPQQAGGVPSQYTDPRYAQGTNNIDPSAIAQASQDPSHPAHPKHPHHSQWASKLGSKLGNAVVFGAGATAGADLVNSVFH